MSPKKKFICFAQILIAFVLLGTYLPDCVDPEATCIATVEAAAQAIVRCERGNYLEETKQSLIEQWALGDCKLIKKVRDPKALLNDCLPWLAKVPCHVLASGRRPPACQNQLLLKADEF